MKIFILLLFFSVSSKGNEFVINECNKFSAIFTTEIIQRNNKNLVIDQIIKGCIDWKMLVFAKNYEKSDKLKSNKIIFMFYPNGEKSFESHSIDKNGGFYLRINGNKKYCLVKDLTDNFSKLHK